MNIFKFGEFETEIDPTDVEFLERYENAAENYEKEIVSPSGAIKASEEMKRICQVFFKTFDTIFGENVHKKMFGDRRSVDLCVDAFQELLAVTKDHTQTLDKLNSLGGANRATRRAKK